MTITYISDCSKNHKKNQYFNGMWLFNTLCTNEKLIYIQNDSTQNLQQASGVIFKQKLDISTPLLHAHLHHINIHKDVI